MVKTEEKGKNILFRVIGEAGLKWEHVCGACSGEVEGKTQNLEEDGAAKV